MSFKNPVQIASHAFETSKAATCLIQYSVLHGTKLNVHEHNEMAKKTLENQKVLKENNEGSIQSQTVIAELPVKQQKISDRIRGYAGKK